MKLREKLVEKISSYTREEYLKKITNNIGEIEEYDDKFICMVNQKKLDSFNIKNRYGTIELAGIDLLDSECIKLNVNKPLQYIFDEIKFNNSLTFYGTNDVQVSFRCCEFMKNINILFFDGTLIFQDNEYQSNWYDSFLNKDFLYGRKINKIMIFEEKYINSNLKNKLANFGFNVEAKYIDIVDSKLEVRNPGVCYIKADKLSINNSEIITDELYIDANQIDSTSDIHSKNITINNKNNNTISNIYANTFIYNNMLLKDDDKIEPITIDKEKLDKQKLKINIVNLLNQLKIQCESLNKQELEEKEIELNGREISKILKK